jgi:hypothetical protein
MNLLFARPHVLEAEIQLFLRGPSRGQLNGMARMAVWAGLKFVAALLVVEVGIAVGDGNEMLRSWVWRGG